MTMLLLRCPAATTSAAAAATSTCSSKLESLFGPPSISRGRRPASTSTSTPAGTSIQQSQSPSLWHTATFSQNRRPQNTRINFRHFHYSVSTFGKNKDAEKAAPTEVELAETEETVPEWQNPLHHNNSEVNKMFEEDFQEGQEIVPAPLPPFETDPEKVVAPPHGKLSPLVLTSLVFSILTDLSRPNQRTAHSQCRPQSFINSNTSHSYILTVSSSFLVFRNTSQFMTWHTRLLISPS
jgi:hypothetical protein